MTTPTLSNPALERGSPLGEALWQAVGVTWALIMAGVLYIAARDHHPVFTSQNECGTDPRDFLRAGEFLEKDTLRFIVNSHCSNAMYLSDGWIELRYNRVAVDVKTQQFNIAGTPYYKVVWVGGVTEP
jgi:hypothetical protein